MNRTTKLFTMLSIAAMMFLSLLTTHTQAQTATSFSGDATGVIANATVAGVTVNATIAPTGALATTSAGDRRTAAPVFSAGIFLGGVVGSNSALTTEIVTARTSSGQPGVTAGDPGAGLNTSQSQAVVNNLNLGIMAVAGVNAGLSVTGETITANTNCSCGSACTGTSEIKNLRVNGLLVSNTGAAGTTPFVVVSGTVTTQTNINNGNVFLVASPNSQITVLGGTVILTLNQQIFNGPGDITVNALRIQTANLLGVTTNIIVAQAHSDITCAAVGGGLADLQAVKTGVLAGELITFTITVTNIGGTTATNVILTDPLPAGTFFISATPGTGTNAGFVVISDPSNGATSTITARAASLAPGQTATLIITVGVGEGTPDGAEIVNVATVRSDTTEVTLVNNVGRATVIFMQPTAATVTVSGRVLKTLNGRGVSRALVTLTNTNGEVLGSTFTNPFGYYRFNDIPAGESYIFEVRHKLYNFDPRVINLTEDSAVNFVAQNFVVQQ